MKKCFKCQKDLPESNFYKHPKMADGLLKKCKGCAIADVLAHRSKNIEAIRAYDRTRPRRGDPAVWRKNNPHKRFAHDRVQVAIRNGSLKKQPCVVCGSEKSLAHHEDYKKPLEVVWYCQLHHMERHKILDIDKGANC